ncbi:hypothetical protein [Vibrio coralliilyticus]|uniref:hypothetical protein n=1 Tax=Vibrio coralliilyticus TaxID=190893 RepID=UPI0015600C3D|nr:hypothetical protein [Vibrio coralliilyticus]NRF16613.1 hypothetical protein [Vibrio coralliilyticus]
MKSTTPINIIILCPDFMATKPTGTCKEKYNQARKLLPVFDNYRKNKAKSQPLAHNLTITFPDGTWIFYPQGAQGITAYKEIDQ